VNIVNNESVTMVETIFIINSTPAINCCKIYIKNFIDRTNNY